MKKIKFFIIVFLIIILFIIIYFINNNFKLQKFDDILFIKLFSNNFQKDFKQELEQKEYRIEVTYKNIKLNTINLSETINKKSLINEKIAPGTSGSFNIKLNSNQDLRYKVNFSSLNPKPRNLNFEALVEDRVIAKTNTLDELSERLTGIINKNQKINITINWYWNYEENGYIESFQDTMDAKNIKKYQFDILVLGEKII